VSKFVDIHSHVISSDQKNYPRAPLFGVQSEWSKSRPIDIDGLVKMMDEAKVDKAALVHAPTCYGYDNSYVCDSIKKYPGRFTVVGSVDVMQPDAPATLRKWMDRGLTGLRLFTGGGTGAFDTTDLDNPQSFPAWVFCGEVGIPICIQTGAAALAQVAGLAKRFPKTKIILDHLARPDIKDGSPYNGALSLFAMGAFENIYLKVTPRVFEMTKEGKATSETFFAKLVSVFGARRLAWGSNCPATAGTMAANLEHAKSGLSSLSTHDQAWIFAKTAQTLYPTLADY
jgi:predicted TIM-barrel fold metal-dependent hydrolase